MSQLCCKFLFLNKETFLANPFSRMFLENVDVNGISGFLLYFNID